VPAKKERKKIEMLSIILTGRQCIFPQERVVPAVTSRGLSSHLVVLAGIIVAVTLDQRQTPPPLTQVLTTQVRPFKRTKERRESDHQGRCPTMPPQVKYASEGLQKNPDCTLILHVQFSKKT
jgi:hypothetical protein